MPTCRRRLLLLAVPAACALAWAGPAGATSAPPDAAVRRTRSQLDRLQALQAEATGAQRDADSLQADLQALAGRWQAAQAAAAPVRTALQALRSQALPPLAPLHLRWRDAVLAVDAAATAHQAAVASLLAAAPAGRPAAMDRLDTAADRRRGAEAAEAAARRALDGALSAAGQAVATLEQRWMALAWSIDAVAASLRRAADNWQALQRRWQGLRSTVSAAGLGAIALPALPAAAPWSAPAESALPARPDDAALRAWRAADGRSQQALQLQWLQADAQAAVQQALADADCAGERCGAWRADAAALRGASTGNQAALATALADQAAAAETLAALPDTTEARLQALLGWRDSLGLAVTQAGGPALRQLQLAGATGEAAQAALAQATGRAQAAWIAALQRQYGENWMDQLDPPGAGSQAQASMRPPSIASPVVPLLSSHALHRLRARDDEPAGFGAYTYVLVGASVQPGTPGVRARLQRLLGEVRSLPTAGQITDAQQRSRTNTFVVPVARASSDDAELAVDLPLAQSLLTHLPPVLRLADATRRLLYAENGPFLVTLPGRLADARADWPLLFADLSKTPEVVVADVVRRYMADLIGSFNPASTDWQPPAGMQVAITLVRLVKGSGDMVQAVFGPAGR